MEKFCDVPGRYEEEGLPGLFDRLLGNAAVGIVQLDWRGPIVEANERAAAHVRNGAGLTDLVRTVLSAAAAPWPRNAEGTPPRR